MAVPQGLLDLIERVRRAEGGPMKPLSVRQLSERSGGKIDRTTLGQIVNNTHSGNFDVDTIHGLVTALAPTPADEVWRLLGQPGAPKPFVEEMPAHVDLLNRRQRDAVLDVINAMVAPEGRAYVTPGADVVTPIRSVRPKAHPVRQKPERAAARRTDEKPK